MELLFASKDDAQAIKEMAEKIVEQSGFLSVHELHQMAGLITTMLDCSKGWPDLSTLEIRDDPIGWVIGFPDPEQLPEFAFPTHQGKR